MFTSIGKTLTRLAATVGDSINGPNYLRKLAFLIEDNDEQRAHELYLEILNDTTLDMMQVNPSIPYTFRQNPTGDTFLHMAARQGMLALVRVFLEKGGNPNVTDARSATVLHALCSLVNGNGNGNVSGNANASKSGSRQDILEYIQTWRKVYFEAGLVSEDLAINHLDIDGNSAMHLAAMNGQLECVKKLVEMNSNLSIVNKIQLTCCELALESHFEKVSDMLELALLFPLAEDGDIFEANANLSGPQQQRHTSLIFANNKSFQSDNEVGDYIENTIQYLIKALTEMDIARRQTEVTFTYEKAELLLNEFNWDSNKLLHAHMNDKRKYTLPLIQSLNESSLASGSSSGDGLYHTTSCSICMDDMDSTPMTSVPLNVNSSSSSSSVASSDAIKPSIQCNFGHLFCKDCWAQNSCTLVDNESCNVLSCPGHKCKQILDHRIFGRYLLRDDSSANAHTGAKTKGDRYSKFLDFRNKRVVSAFNHAWKYCPCANCTSILICQGSNDSLPTNTYESSRSKPSAAGGGGILSNNIDDADLQNKTAICSNFHSICMICQGPAHSLLTCTQWEKWKKVVAKRIGSLDASSTATSAANAANQMADQLWLAANTKPCPSCQSAIEKNDGCNHMTCRKCRHEFCWICMQNWSLHSTKTGGSFQCNMKLPSSNMNGSKNDDEDDELLKDLVVDSKGGAKAETARLKLVQQNTAIFITYFTRFKAHDDSLKMEIGRMPETIRRVSKCLVDSFYSLPGPVIKPTSLCIPGEIGVTSPVNPNKSGIKVEVVRMLDLGGPSSRKGDNSVVWLQGNRVIHPVSAYLAREEESSSCSSDLSAPYLNRVAAKDCLKFLFEGFIELIKCRETLKGIAMFSYFHFGKSQLEESPDSNPNKVSPFRSLLKSHQPSSLSMSSRQGLMDFKASLDRLATELEKYTEMLSDVVARRRLRASQYIIVNMSTLAREKRQECEDCVLVHTQPMPSAQHSATSKSSYSGLSRTSNKDSDSDNDILSAFENIFSSFMPMTSKKSGGSVPGKPATKSPTSTSTSTATATPTYTATATATSANKTSSGSSSKPPPTVGGSSSEDADFDRAIQLSLADSLPLGGTKTGGRAVDDFDIALQRSLDASSAINSSTNPRAANSNSRAPNTIGAKASDQSVATLVAMGFDRAKAKEILARCDNDLDRALNALL